MKTKKISFSFAYQNAEYEDLLKEVVEKMYNAGLEMLKDKNIAICYEGEESEKTYDNSYDAVRHVIGEWEKPSKNDDFLKNVWTVSTETTTFRNGKDVDLECKGF